MKENSNVNRVENSMNAFKCKNERNEWRIVEMKIEAKKII